MTRHYPYEALRQWSQAILQAADVPAADALITAECLLRADARGVPTHGISRLASYVQKLATGEVNPQPAIVVQAQAGILTVEADGALGQVAARLGLERGLEMLQRHAVVVCQLRECGHLGALGMLALQAAEAGALAIVAQRTPPLLSMPGLQGPVVGNNPLAFACPVAGQPPLVVDMASSVAARGHILLRARKGEAIPEGWAVDEQGEATTDAQAALAGSLLPSGGHKGLALAILVEMLAGAMTAFESSVQRVGSEPRVTTHGAVGRQNACLLLFNAHALAPQTLPHEAQPTMAARYMCAWTESYLARGGPSARLPGQRGHALEVLAMRSGIAVPDALHQELQDLGSRLGCPLPAAIPHPTAQAA